MLDARCPFGLGEHDRVGPRTGNRGDIGGGHMPVERIDAHQRHDFAVAEQIFGHRGARGLLARERYRILKVEDDRVGARCGGLGEALRPVAGDEKE